MARSSAAARLQGAVRIHHEIVSGTYPSATRLAEVLQTTPKTARKYVGILAETFGLHPQYDAQRHGYYYPDGQRPRLIPRLTEKEVAAVFLIEQAARSLHGSPVEAVLQSVLDKLALMIPAGAGVTMEQASSALSLRLERADCLPGPTPAVLETLYAAMVEQRRVVIAYQGRQRRELTQRMIDPLHLTRCEGQWYLVAYCHLRKAIRTFVPARILTARKLNAAFERPKDFDPEEHFRTAFGIVAEYKVASVALRFDAEVAQLIRERRWHATQKLEELPGGEVRLRVTCSQSQELTAWLLSWGEHVRVEAPAELARAVAEAHRRAAARVLGG